MHPLVIDAFEFCRLKQADKGEIPVAALARLAVDAASDEGVIRWSLAGEIDELGHSRLLLSISGTTRMICQRCLTPLAVELASDSVLILAKDEASADRIEELLDDDDIDVVVVPKQLNVGELVEDEALLAAPISPRHAECPTRALSEMPTDTGKAPSPFDALKDLKR